MCFCACTGVCVHTHIQLAFAADYLITQYPENYFGTASEHICPRTNVLTNVKRRLHFFSTSYSSVEVPRAVVLYAELNVISVH